MSDRVDPQSSSWSIAPSAYLDNRDIPYTKSDTPESVYITMRDGCRLAADIYLPHSGADPGGDPGADPGIRTLVQAPVSNATFPAVLIFTPYYRRFRTDGTIAEPAPAAARCGRSARAGAAGRRCRQGHPAEPQSRMIATEWSRR